MVHLRSCFASRLLFVQHVGVSHLLLGHTRSATTGQHSGGKKLKTPTALTVDAGVFVDL